MTLDPITQVRYKTTLNETLLPDQVIQDLIDANTVNGVWNFEATVADCFDYLVAATMGVDGVMGMVKTATVGATSVTYANTFADSAQYWRNRAGVGGRKLTVGSITRADYETDTGAEFGNG